MNTFTIMTSDNYPIVVTPYGINNSTNHIIVISSAIGVPQTFYTKFAIYLANKGFLVFTYDYRGIGQSKPKHLEKLNANFSDWAQKDFKGLTNYLDSEYPMHEKFLIGHSMGGIILGLSDAFKSYSKFITIGSQFGYIKNFHNKDKFKIRSFFQLAIPLLTPFYGYFPSKLLGMGEALPKGIARDWRYIIMNKNSTLSYADLHGNFFAEITQPMLVISIDDDYMAPPRTVDLYAELMVKNAEVTRLNIIPSEYGLENIGHMDFFRSKKKNILWQIPLDYINQS